MSKEYRKTILLVEKQGDSSVSRNEARKKDLEKLDYDVVMAETGEEAIQLVGSGAEIDLILMNVDLGDGMGGIQSAEAILEKRELPVVFLVSDTETNIEGITEHIMCYGFISKNSSTTLLNTSLKMALKLHRERMKEKERIEELQFQASILDQIGDFVTVTDADGIIMYVNEAECKAIGKKKDQIIGRSTEVFGEDPEHGATQKEILEAIREKGSWKGEVVNFDSNNNRIVMDCRTWAMRDSTGAAHAFIGISSDITERKKMEEALQNALIEAENGKRTLDALMEHIPVGITIADANLRLLNVSRRGLEVMGWPINRHVGLSVEEILSEWEVYMADGITKARVEELPLPRAIMNGETVFGQEIVQRHADGRTIPLICDAGPIRDSEGQITGGILAWQDITERKQAEEMLKASEEQHSAILRSIGDGVIACDSEGKVTYLNIAAEAFTGWKSTEAAGLAVEKVFNIINAKTGEIVENPVRISIKEGINVDLANHTKLIAKNGTEYQIADCCAPIRDTSEAVTGAVLVFRDVTEIYHRREALRESEEKYYALFNQSTEGIYLHDTEGRILDVNDMACKQSGYSREEWLGLTVFDGLPDQSTKNPPKAEILRIWSQWVPGQRFTVEAEHQRKDGTIYPVEISTGMVRYGKTNAMLAIVKDITERKQSEDILRKTRLTVDESPLSIFWISPEGKFIYVNKTASSKLGYSPDELLSMHVWDIDPNYPKEKRIEQLNLHRQVGERTFESDHMRRDGTTFPVKINVYHLDFEGQEMEVAVAEDITERKLAEKAREKSLEEKNILLSEIHHRVKNNMAVISSLLTLQSEFCHQKKDPEKLIKDLQTRILSMAWVHELVYESKDYTQIQYAKILKQLADYLKNSYHPDDKEILMQVHSDDILMDMNSSVPLTLLIAELLVNAWKHAFLGRRKGRIELILKEEKEGFRMIVRDDGVGVPNLEKLNQPDSFGYTIIHGLARQLRGELYFSSSAEGGLNVEAWLPNTMNS